jgi:subtilisin-like proprotein convertase family protein
VFLPAGLPACTPFTITITAANIVADGVPNSGTALDQDFALSVLNASEAVTPNFALAGVTLSGENFQPANGLADPGETISVTLRLRNVGSGPSSATVVTLQPGGGVTSPGPAQSYGAMPAGGDPLARTFRLRVDPALACTGTLNLAFQIQDGATDFGTFTAALQVGTFVANGTAAGANPAALTLPAGAPGTTSGPASLYPADITIARATGRVLSATVTLTNLSHTFPHDLDMVLVGPGGQRLMLMSNAGGGGDVTGINLTFDDAAGPLPNSGLTSGTYAPGNNAGSSVSLPAPAPPAPYGAALSIFDATDPNGTWSLYINDNSSGDTGSMGGWSLSIGLEVPSCAPAGISVAPSSLFTSEDGGAAAFEVVLNRAPSSNVTIAVSSGDASEGSVSRASLTFTPANWNIPQSVTVTGLPDELRDGDVAYSVVLAPAASADTSYAGLNPHDVAVVNLEGRDSSIFLPLVRR